MITYMTIKKIVFNPTNIKVADNFKSEIPKSILSVNLKKKAI